MNRLFLTTIAMSSIAFTMLFAPGCGGEKGNTVVEAPANFTPPTPEEVEEMDRKKTLEMSGGASS